MKTVEYALRFTESAKISRVMVQTSKWFSIYSDVSLQ